MDGFKNIKVSPLGHLRVLISRDLESEVKEMVGPLWWWCTWFDRFEEWSLDLVSNQRIIWLRCFGVPLHAWEGSLFKSIAFKHGSFIEVDILTS
jgi:hypothetical protein